MADLVRVSISLPSDLARRVRAAAREDREALSSWIAEAAQRKLLLRGASRAIAQNEVEPGVITDQDIVLRRA